MAPQTYYSDMKKKEKFISQCCVCKKVRRKDGFKFTDNTHMDEWGHHQQDVEKAKNTFDVVISHGICEPCAEDWLKNTSKPV